MAKITIEKAEITLLVGDFQDYISLTDMANAKEGESRCKYPIFHTGYKLNFKYADFV